MTDDDRLKDLDRLIPNDAPTPVGEPLVPTSPKRRRHQMHPQERDAATRERKLVLKEVELKQRSQQLARIEKVIAPWLKCEPPRDVDDILLRADAAYRMAMVLNNPAAAVNAARLEADCLGVIVQRSAVLHGNASADEISRANSRDEIVDILQRRLGLGGKGRKLFLEFLAALEREGSDDVE
jgi:hypothetical protein